MRIAELINNLEIGGAERMVVDLARALQHRRHEVTVICLRELGPLSRVLEDAKIEIVPLHKGTGFQFSVVSALTRELRARRIEIIHTHNPVVHHYGMISGKLARVPGIITTLHGPGNLKGLGRTEAIFELSCLFSTKVVACCQAVGDHLARISPIGRRISTVIGNGIEVERFLPVRPRVREGEIVFGTVGRLVPVKDHKTLMEGVARVLQSGRQCRLKILGDGILRKELEAYAERLGVAGRVHFHGSDLDVVTFLAEIDVFALTSQSEGLPLTVLEAMAAGLPILGTSVGAIPELVASADCGWIVPVGSPDQLAAAMLEATEDSDLRGKGERGRDYVLQHHSLESMTAGYERLFEETIAAAGPHRTVSFAPESR